jgi:hypothetical protein
VFFGHTFFKQLQCQRCSRLERFHFGEK